MINLSNLNIDNSIPFYVIHYNKSTDRKKRLIEEFKKYDINNIVWMDKYNREDMGELKNLYQCKLPNQKLNNAQISVTLKHYLSLKDIVDKKIKYAVVMEDNVTFKNDIKKLVHYYIFFSIKFFNKSI